LEFTEAIALPEWFQQALSESEFIVFYHAKVSRYYSF